MTAQQRGFATKVLFWVAFGVFLAVSVPHIAWVFHQYEPNEGGFTGVIWWLLAYGFALAIDGVIGWLSHVGSEGSTTGDKVFTWAFIIILVAMSWYYNWVFSIAHDPSRADASEHVWSSILVSQWWFLPQVTVGAFTPLIISALPVFIIAYTFILGKVNHMKVTAAKSLEDLKREADEAEQRAEAERRIRNAGKTGTGEAVATKAIGSVFGLVKQVQEQAAGLAGEKKDPQAEKQELVVQLFRGTPSLLSEENKELAATAIIELLHLKRPATAHFWRLKAQELLTREAAQNEQQQKAIEATNTPEREQAKAVSVEPQNALKEESKTGAKPEGPDEQNLLHYELSEEEKQIAKSYPKMLSLLATGESTATLEMVSEATGYGVKKLQNRVTKGEVKATPRNKNIVFIDSVIAWLKDAPVPVLSESETHPLSSRKTGRKGVQSTQETHGLAERKTLENADQNGIIRISHRLPKTPYADEESREEMMTVP